MNSYSVSFWSVWACKLVLVMELSHLRDYSALILLYNTYYGDKDWSQFTWRFSKWHFWDIHVRNFWIIIIKIFGYRQTTSLYHSWNYVKLIHRILSHVRYFPGKHIGRLGHQDPGEFPEEVKALFEKAVEYYEENMALMVEIQVTHGLHHYMNSGFT